MNIEELKRLAEAASDVNWMHLCRENPVVFSGKYAAYIAAANPAAVLELIAEVEALRANATGLEHQLRESRQNDYHALSYLADCRFAVGDDGKRMLPEFVEYLKALKQQRDELLASLKEARELVEDWGAYAPAYMQEKHDLEGDMNKLDAAIANAEKSQ
jgi:hypothetical protein